jgi:hypothetical protein
MELLEQWRWDGCNPPLCPSQVPNRAEATYSQTTEVKHVAGLVDSDVEARIEITAKSEDGFAYEVARTVTENTKT